MNSCKALVYIVVFRKCFNKLVIKQDNRAPLRKSKLTATITKNLPDSFGDESARPKRNVAAESFESLSRKITGLQARAQV